VHQVARDRQADAHTAVRARQRRIALVEALPHTRYLLVAHTNARVRHLDPRTVGVFGVAAQMDRYLAAFGREFECIAHVVAQHLLQLVVVRCDLADRPVDTELEPDLLAFRGSATLVDDLSDHLLEIDGLRLEALRSRFEPREVEQAVDQLQQSVPGGANIRDVSVAARRKLAAEPTQQHIGVAQN